jgi:hypothetical protein
MTPSYLPEPIICRRLARLRSYAHNAHTHSDDQWAKVVGSPVAYAPSPILVSDDGAILKRLSFISDEGAT